MTLGDRVKALREARGLSRATLAREAEVSYAFIQQLETGVRRDPGVKNLAAVAAQLGVSVDSLLEGGTNGAALIGVATTPRPAPARRQIEELLEEMSDEELISARDLLRVLRGRGRPKSVSRQRASVDSS